MEYFRDATNLLPVLKPNGWPFAYKQFERADKFTYYRILANFILPTGLYDPTDWALRADTSLCLSKGDIIQVCSVRYKDSGGVHRMTNICIFENRAHPFGSSSELFTKNPLVFEDITTQIRREYQLIKILN